MENMQSFLCTAYMVHKNSDRYTRFIEQVVESTSKSAAKAEFSKMLKAKYKEHNAFDIQTENYYTAL